jgi:hypothetical protein
MPRGVFVRDGNGRGDSLGSWESDRAWFWEVEAREGKLGGRPGLAIEAVLVCDKVDVVLLGGVGLAAAPSATACASNSRRVGGSGGRVAWLNAGGSLRGPVSDPCVVVEVRPREFVDMAECCDHSDEAEPLLPLTVNWLDGLRGGINGEGWVDVFRVGRGGRTSAPPF